MRKICKLTIRLILLSALFVLMSTSAYALIYTSNNSGDWHSTVTWNQGAVPGPDDDVIIGANTSVFFTSNIAQVNDITIVDDGELRQRTDDQQIIDGTLNLPSSMQVHASQMYAKNVFSFVTYLLKEGQLNIDEEDEIISGAMFTHQGKITHEPTLQSINNL